MRILRLLLIVLILIQIGANVVLAREFPSATKPAISVSDLPKEARATLALIKKGGPFTNSRDGIVFGNFERRLPAKERGYYKEYTVPTSGSRDRGARRIIVGRQAEYFYTDDHYKTFRRIRK
jgi:ribonuclease T1